MSFWVIAQSPFQPRIGDSVMYIPAGGLPDISRALNKDHLREWVKHISEGAAPEFIMEKTDYYWKLFEDIHQDDFIIIITDEHSLAIGEVTGNYQFEKVENSGRHAWPVRWIAQKVALSSFPSMRQMLGTKVIVSIPASEARITFRKYFPSLHTKGYLLFKWMSIGMLIAELTYFWPKK